MTAVLRRFRTALPGLLMLLCLPGASQGQEPLLLTAAQVQRLSPEEARLGRTVRLRGVVTFTWHTGTTEFTLEDDTGGVWLPPIALPSNCRVGTAVEIEGSTDTGLFGPFVHATAVRPLGAALLPPPQRATYDELLATPLHSRRVEIVGIVRRQRANPEMGLDWLALEVATGGGRITVNVTHEITGHPELIDARVCVRGVNLHSTDVQQQAFLPMINAHSLADIEVLTPANPLPFDQPVRPLVQLMRSTSVAGSGHRVRVCGSVTFVGRGDSFYLQDESRGMQVFLREALRPICGEVVDVVGFPEPGAFSPVLRDAEWRPARAGGAPVAKLVTLSEAPKHDGRLLAVEGRVTEITTGDGEVVLTLEESGKRCRVHVLNARANDWDVHSTLRATGVCSVEIGDWEFFVAQRNPLGFSLLVQVPDSLSVVRSAPWWNPARVAWLLAAAAGTLSCGLGVVWWRTQARLRETARTWEAAEAQFEAVLAERNRIAREIHDTMAQGFAGTSAQLEVLSDRQPDLPPALRHHLNLARDLVQNSLEEARRSVWNLRSTALEQSSLGGALDRFGRELTAGGTTTFESQIEGPSRPLATDVENNLLRIGQEAVTNAVRHAGAKRITLTLAYSEDCVGLIVSDDGRGLVPAQVPPTTRGGFGLSGMRERAKAMHAFLNITSPPSGGTRLEITVQHV